MTVSAKDIGTLEDHFSRLEMDVDALSAALSRLSNSRRLRTSTGDTSAHHRVSKGIVSNNQEPTSLGSAARPLLLPAVMMMLTAAAVALALRRARLSKVRRVFEYCSRLLVCWHKIGGYEHTPWAYCVGMCHELCNMF